MSASSSADGISACRPVLKLCAEAPAEPLGKSMQPQVQAEGPREAAGAGPLWYSGVKLEEGESSEAGRADDQCLREQSKAQLR